MKHEPHANESRSDNQLDAGAPLTEGDVATRRGFLLSGLALLLAGCSGPQRTTSTTALPGPSWRTRTPPTPMPSPPRRDYVPPSRAGVSGTSSGLIARSRWTSAGPSLALMNRMQPVRCITVHHDGIGPFHDMDQRAAMARLESIRRYHRESLGWGDIGYHYSIDRSGRVYECRSLTYQGAHVKNHNEGNIGVMLLGNFDQQTPSSAQIDALIAQLSGLMQTHGVPVNRVHTHREWQGAVTACPGGSLQASMNNIRQRRLIG